MVTRKILNLRFKISCMPLAFVADIIFLLDSAVVYIFLELNILKKKNKSLLP